MSGTNSLTLPCSRRYSGPVSEARFDPTEIVAPEAAGLCPTRLERLREAFQAYVDNGDLAGAATLIARRGRVAHLGTFGMAHREEGRPVAADTLFRIASMTKPITSVAVMMLVEEGRLLRHQGVATGAGPLCGPWRATKPNSCSMRRTS